MTRAELAVADQRPPRSVAWLLLLASTAAVLVIGLVTTALLLDDLAWPAPLGRQRFWIWLLVVGVACGLTGISLGLRALRWIFLLRRAETRIPIRDAYIGYLAGFSLLLAPLFLGEIAVRAWVHRQRGRVPVVTTAIVNIWERLLDACALAGIVALIAVMSGRGSVGSLALLGVVAATMVPAVRRACLRAVEMVVRSLARVAGPPLPLFNDEQPDVGRLAKSTTWLVALATSVVAWLLPGIAFWGIASVWGHQYAVWRAEDAYASSTLAGGVILAPGGIVVAGGRLLAALHDAGFSQSAVAWSVVGIRLATAGMSTVLGGVFLLVHLRTPARASDHFDQIADAYDVQIPEARRQALLARKTDLMRDVVDAHGVGRQGLDVGCGQGWYVARMRALGFDASGIDASQGQVQLAMRNVGAPGLIHVGSALAIPAADATFDFVYTINVLHHLSSIDEQRAAFAELVRVLRPGGLLFVHEINTRNALFRFYMGYVFPSLNCIDEGVERWLLPHRLGQYTDVPVIDLRYFTFLPEFVPSAIVRLLAPIERRLESSPLRIYSAHFMAVLRKPL